MQTLSFDELEAVYGGSDADDLLYDSTSFILEQSNKLAEKRKKRPLPPPPGHDHHIPA